MRTGARDVTGRRGRRRIEVQIQQLAGRCAVRDYRQRLAQDSLRKATKFGAWFAQVQMARMQTVPVEIALVQIVRVQPNHNRRALQPAQNHSEKT